MQHRRRAELLIVNLRWLGMLTVAFLVEKGETPSVLVGMPLSVFLYNTVTYYICSTPGVYRRYSYWPGYVARAFDLLAITYIATRLGAGESAVYLLYATIIVGTGFVHGYRGAIGVCAVSVLLFHAANGFSAAEVLNPSSLARQLLLPACIPVGVYLEREYARAWGRRESYKRLEGIYQLGTCINERLDTQQIMERTVHTALQLTYGDRCVMALYGPDCQEIDRKVEHTRPGMRAVRKGEGRTIVTEFEWQAEATSSELNARTRTSSGREPARIEAPLSVGTKVIGKLEVESWDPETRMGDHEAQLLTILSSQAATAIQNARMVQELHKQAETDPLTGLLNRRELSQRLQDEIEAAAEMGHPLSLLIFDVDDFKAINENHGHPAGDAVLQEVGHRLMDDMRQGDCCIRYGGDEFLVVLRNIAAMDIPEVVDRLRERIESAPVDLGSGVLYNVRISGGWSCSSLDGCEPESLVHRADERLFQAKHNGKARICGPTQDGETASAAA